jgi:preprotein translocase YajC subunit
LHLLINVCGDLFRSDHNRKKLKRKEFESTLKVGDKIITKSGLHGKVSELADTTVVIETMSGKLKWSDLQFLWK